MNWRELISYPNIITQRVADDLDALQTLHTLPETESNDRYVILSIWLRESMQCGLLSSSEYQAIRSTLAEAM